MKNHIILLSVLFALTSQAQNTISTNNSNWINKELKKTVFSLGINQWTGTNNTELTVLGSRYFGITREKSFSIANSKNSALFIKTGIGISWNNYMFDNNKVIQEVNNQSVLIESKEVLDKSKLTASYLNLPISLDLKFRKGFIQHIAFGTLVGLNIGSHSKIKTENGSSYKTKDNYNLNKLRYGVSTEIGFRNSLDLFVNYDLNQVFQQNKGPEANAISFGIRF